jgi:cold shock CspA family protein
LALIAGDGDFLPLVRKLNTLGTRVMVVGWDFSFTDNNGNLRETRTSQLLYNEATYPVKMDEVIDAPGNENDPLVNNLFHRPEFRPEVRQEFRPEYRQAAALTSQPVSHASALGTVAGTAPVQPPEIGSVQRGRIANLKETYGFIQPETGGDNIFFPFSSLPPGEAQRLRPGTRVSYEYGQGDRGPMAPKVWILLNQD